MAMAMAMAMAVAVAVAVAVAMAVAMGMAGPVLLPKKFFRATRANVVHFSDAVAVGMAGPVLLPFFFLALRAKMWCIFRVRAKIRSNGFFSLREKAINKKLISN